MDKEGMAIGNAKWPLTMLMIVKQNVVVPVKQTVLFMAILLLKQDQVVARQMQIRVVLITSSFKGADEHA